MQTKTVVVMPYDEQWISAFEKIKRELELALGDLAIAVVKELRRRVKSLILWAF